MHAPSPSSPTPDPILADMTENLNTLALASSHQHWHTQHHKAENHLNTLVYNTIQEDIYNLKETLVSHGNQVTFVLFCFTLFSLWFHQLQFFVISIYNLMQ